MAATTLGTATALLMLDYAANQNSESMLVTHIGNAGTFLAGGGLVAGPAMGYLYAGEMGRARGGAIFRAAVGTVSSLVIFALLLDDLNHLFEPEREGHDDAINRIATIGGGAIAISALVDVARLPGVVRRHNTGLTVPRALPSEREGPPPSGEADDGRSSVTLGPTISVQRRALGAYARVAF